MDFLSAIIFEGPMASSIKSENIKTVESVVLDVVPGEKTKVSCTMFDHLTRENVFLHVEFEASIGSDAKEPVVVAFKDASLINGIIKNFPKDTTIFLELSDDNDFVTFSDNAGNMIITEENIDASTIVGYDPETSKLMKYDDDVPSIGGDKKFTVKTGIDMKSLRQIQSMNKTLGTPNIKVRFSDTDVYIVTTDFKETRSNLFKAKITGVQVFDGEWKPGKVTMENKYPIGIIPAIDTFDNATMYARKTDEGNLEQLFFVGTEDNIKKVYMIGAEAKKTD